MPPRKPPILPQNTLPILSKQRPPPPQQRNQSTSNTLPNTLPNTNTLSTFLSAQQSRVLKRLATLTGLGGAGTKAEIAGTLLGAVARARLGDCRRGGGEAGLLQRGGSGRGKESGVENGEEGRRERRERPVRVLSVDMGVKNLAFCVLEVRRDRWRGRNGGGYGEERAEGGEEESGESAVKIVEWKRLDLTAKLRELARKRALDEDEGMMADYYEAFLPPLPPQSTDTGLEQDTETTDTEELLETDPYTDSDIELMPSTSAAKLELSNMFTPSTLSLVAHTLAQDLLSLRPAVILIERQRFRSGGAPQIQEWTVRVNMLEAMLWASLTTLKFSGRDTVRCLLSRDEDDDQSSGVDGEDEAPLPFPELVEMNPRRVGSFWLTVNPGNDVKGAGMTPADIETELAVGREKAVAVVKDEGKTGKTSLEKRDKIALVRRWVQSSSGEGVDLAEALVTGVAAPFVRGRMGKDDGAAAGGKRARDRENNLAAAGVGKLDDLADCVVQGVTFAVWEENRRRVFEYCGVERVDDVARGGMKDDSTEEKNKKEKKKKGSRRRKDE